MPNDVALGEHYVGESIDLPQPGDGVDQPRMVACARNVADRNAVTELTCQIEAMNVAQVIRAAVAAWQKLEAGTEIRMQRRTVVVPTRPMSSRV